MTFRSIACAVALGLAFTLPARAQNALAWKFMAGQTFDVERLASQKQAVELKGKLRTRDGFGTIEVEEAWIASIPVPMSFVEQIVASATRKPSQPEGFDINAPFRLPYAVDRVRLETARAFLDF